MLALLLSSYRMRKRRQPVRPRSESKKPILVCCRICLSKNELHPIFFGKDTADIRSKELQLATGLQIKRNDGLPQKICATCIEALNVSLKLRKTSLEAAKRLMQKQKEAQVNVLEVDEPIKLEVPKDLNDYYESYEDDPFSFANYMDPHKNYDYKSEKGKVNLSSALEESEERIKNVSSHDLKYEPKQPKRKKRQKIVDDPTTPHKCNICGKEYKLLSTFRSHMSVHRHSRVCEVCGKTFPHKSALVAHMQAKHNLEKTFKCSFCDYKACKKETLVIHERSHTGEKPFICDHCGMGFTSRCNMLQHIPLHLPEKTVECTLCNKKFFSKKFLQNHMYRMHKDKPYFYECKACKNLFRSTHSARKHMNKAHGMPKEIQGPLKRVPRSQRDSNPFHNQIDDIVKPVDSAEQKSVDSLVQKPMGSLVQKPVDSLVQKPIDSLVEKPMPSLVQRPMPSLMQKPMEMMVSSHGILYHSLQ